MLICLKGSVVYLRGKATVSVCVCVRTLHWGKMGQTKSKQ